MPSERATAIATKADATLAVLLGRADAARDTPLGDAYRGRRVADVVAHLYVWHIVFEGWVSQERSGAVPAYPAEGYTWETLDSLNDAMYAAHSARPFEALRAMLVSSHRAMLQLLATFSEHELVDPSAYPWLGGQALGDVADECLGAHYEWALRTLDAANIA